MSEKITTVYSPAYKCRLCGETFNTDELLSKDEAEMITNRLLENDSYIFRKDPARIHKISTIRKNAIHRCFRGSFGFADLIGMEMDVIEND